MNMCASTPPRCDANHARPIALQIRERLDEFRFAGNERRFRIGIGMSLVPIDDI